jgi:tRNA(Ile)-lysidine synthase
VADAHRPRLDPATAAVRTAVRTTLTDLAAPGDVVLAACSGGADSLALAAALAFESGRAGVTAGAVTVDHGLQEGSAGRAAEVADQLAGLGLMPVVVRTARGGAAGGPEAAARTGRYTALTAAARDLGAGLVLLGHTRDDQAEAVLLGLARGSGARSLAGMRDRRSAFAADEPADEPGPEAEQRATPVVFARPLLHLSRSATATACAAAGLDCWADPHNVDPVFARARVRHRVLPVLEQELGPGIAEALARSADLLRDDADALDALAAEVVDAVRDAAGGIQVDSLAGHPRAVRTRVLRAWLLASGAAANDLTRSHVLAVDALATAWHGQGPLALPGGLRAYRDRGPAGQPVLRADKG